jgi:hypothetical protein
MCSEFDAGAAPVSRARRGMSQRMARVTALLVSAVLALALAPVRSVVADEANTLAVKSDPERSADGCSKGSEDESFFRRIKDSYQSHLSWNGGDPNAPPTKIVDGPEVPVSNPPWPYSTWNVGGSPAIGVENLYYSALMDALYCGRGGQKLKDSRFTIYGWIEPGGNISTSSTHFNYSTGTGGNFPAAYSYRANTLQMDQIALYFERTPDMVQKDHVDWGFRVTALYGTDYKYTFSNGILSNQYLNNSRQYGFDPVMYYLDFWLPKLGPGGTNIRAGRYISIPDIEAQLAPNNLTYSHSLLYTVDPYTQTGVIATTRWTRNWMTQFGVTAGNDVAPWVKSEAQPSATVCVVWTSNSGHDQIYPCANTINDSRWRWNNVQHAVATWYHKFDSHWHMATEAYYMWQSHTPNVNTPEGIAFIAQRYNYVNVGAPSGAQCNSTAEFCYSYEWAIVNYLNYQIDPRNVVVWRSDFLNDARGQRTGFKTRYLEFDLSYTHWLGDVIELRPELRFEHALDVDAYDNPSATSGAGKHSQFMFAADAIFHF